MKTLYVGQLWEGGTCRSRLETLERLGLSTVPFDVTPFQRMGIRLERSMQSRFGVGRGISRLNRALHECAKSNSYDIVWIDKGVWLYPETLEALKMASSRRFAVHYTPDPQIVYNRSSHFLESIPSYDLVITTKAYELQGYGQHGAKQTMLVQQGYSRRFILQTSISEGVEHFRTDVCFIGRYESYYANRVRAAMSCTTNVGVWGPRWPRYAHIWRTLKPAVRGSGVWGEQYPVVLSCAKIGLGLLTKLAPDTNTTRTFEIPASGSFLLAERNEDHQSLFDEGNEAEFFSSDNELRDKIRFYLSNDQVRKKIAAAGRERCVRSGYSEENQLRTIIGRISSLV